MRKSLVLSMFVVLAVVIIASTVSALSWTTTIPDQNIEEDSGTTPLKTGTGETITDLSSYVDDTGVTFAVTLENASKVNCEIDSDGKNPKITPAANFFGTATCMINATKGDVSVGDEFTITVVNVQDDPVWTALPAQAMNPGETKNITLSSYVTDADGDPLTYTAVASDNTIATCSVASGVLTITASATKAGTATCTVTADDAHGTPKSVTFNILTSKLELYDLDITTSGGSNTNLHKEKDGYTVAKEAEPGSEITVSFIVKNAFDDKDDIDIDDITATLTLEAMGDEDEQEEEIDIGSLEAEKKSERVDVKFDVPLELDEGEYELLIEIEGEDDNGAVHSITKTLNIEVKKESHKLKLTQYDLMPTEMTCDRSARLNVEVVNIGKSDEKNVVVEVKNSALGIALTQNIGELEKEYDEDNEWSGTFTFDIDGNAKAGTYTLDVIAYRSSTVKADAKTVSLVVKDCAAEPEVEVQNIPTTAATETTEDEYTETTETPFLESKAFMVLLIVGIAVVAALIVLLLVLLFKR